jgi:hypothetical protein
MRLSTLAEHIENVPLVDHHVHGCWLDTPARVRSSPMLQGFVAADEWSETDAIRVVDLIAHANACRVYGLS